MLARHVWITLLLLIASLGPAQAADLPARPDDGSLIEQIRQSAIPLSGAVDDYAPLLEAIGDASVVLLGEATHGSAEFQEERSRITKRLIEQKGFRAVLLEAGWAPVLAVNAYVQGRAPGPAAVALAGFQRFPRWMWRNAEFAATVDSLRELNAAGSRQPAIALYGMDVQEAPETAAAVLAYLQRVDPRAAREARSDFACFTRYARLDADPQWYGRDLLAGRIASCRRRVVARAEQLRRSALRLGDTDSFAAWMGARSIVGAEADYRTLYRIGGLDAWNVRERHMADTIRLMQQRHGKVIVWAHNTHQGDARVTEHAQRGILSLGQLLRERIGDDKAFLLGFSTYEGTVRAASGRDAADQELALLPSIDGSWHSLLHQLGIDRFMLLFRGNEALSAALDQPRKERAIGVAYSPADEASNHYFMTRIGRRFDALIHIDRSSALHPLQP